MKKTFIPYMQSPIDEVTYNKPNIVLLGLMSVFISWRQLGAGSKGT